MKGLKSVGMRKVGGNVSVMACAVEVEWGYFLGNSWVSGYTKSVDGEIKLVR